MTTTTRLVCPGCGEGDHLRSIETALIAYPAYFSSDGPPYYTGEVYEVFDEGTKFEDNIDCGNCDRLGMTLADLVAEKDDDEVSIIRRRGPGPVHLENDGFPRLTWCGMKAQSRHVTVPGVVADVTCPKCKTAIKNNRPRAWRS